MKLSCSTQVIPGETYLEKFRKAKELGFEGLEIRLLAEDNLEWHVREIRKASEETGIRPSSLLMPGPIFRRPLDSEETKRAKTEHMKRALDVAVKLGCPTLACAEYGYQDPLPLFNIPERPSPEEDRLLIEFLRDTTAYAEQVGGVLLLEPINRYESHFYHSLAQAARYVDEVGSPHLKILADFFHMNIEEANIPASIKAAGLRIGHVHLGDSNRLLPGYGHTDFRAGFKALREIGYTGYMALECAVSGDPEAELSKCVRFLRRCMDETAQDMIRRPA
ncbi:MAG: sugar phosphate isomerase/epimerase [Bacillota bacterium]|nr:sugar phosphate isomerase/epimerase [Bacillota bacterium]